MKEITKKGRVLVNSRLGVHIQGGGGKKEEDEE